MKKEDLIKENKYLAARVECLLSEIKDSSEPNAEDYLALVSEMAYMASVLCSDALAREGFERIVDKCSEYFDDGLVIDF